MRQGDALTKSGKDKMAIIIKAIHTKNVFFISYLFLNKQLYFFIS